MEPFHAKTFSGPLSAERAGLRVMVRSDDRRAAGGSGQTTHNFVRITYGHQREGVQPRTKCHVIMKLWQAHQLARIAALANRIGQIVPRLQKNTAGDGGRVTEISRRPA